MLTMEEAMKQSTISFVEGEIIEGEVIEIRSKEVLVNINFKSEGSVSLNEFDEDNQPVVGDKIEVLIEVLENREGMVELSHERAEFKKNWDKINSICEEGGVITGRIKEIVKGGLIVNIGVEAFLPSSQVDIVPPKDLKALVGQKYEFKIVKLNMERQNIVLSRRELIEEERSAKRAEMLGHMTPGDVRKGVVKNITDFGAFIDLDGLDGLLHITDMSWGRINHPSEMVTVGEEVDVVVLDINKEKERVSLGLKQKSQNPWELIESKYPVNTTIKGKVVNLVSYGAFVELEPGVEGLVHVTELSWTKKHTKPSEVLEKGQEIEAMVLGVNKDEQKISLGIRQLDDNPWDAAGDKYAPGTTVKGKVRNLTSYGAFVELEEGLDGMIHVSDLSWTRKINHPSELLKKGDEIEARVLEVDRENQRISIGIKQLGDDPWDQIDTVYKVGDLVTGKVTKLASFGAFVGLENEMDGLVHISQISEERVEKIKSALEVGQEVKARVIKIDKSDRRIGLSIKAAEYDEDQLRRAAEQLDQLKPGEDLVALEHAFDAAGLTPAENAAPEAEAPKEEAAAEPEAKAEPEEKAAEPEAEAEPEEKAAEPEAKAEPEEKAAEPEAEADPKEKAAE
jgi:small subunit ribosomal protein S1